MQTPFKARHRIKAAFLKKTALTLNNKNLTN